jgi:hypothetical protein
LDYVVFGIGFGATILVLGLLLRDFGPSLRFRKSRDGGAVLGAEELVGKISWSRFCAALGSVLALAGAAFLLLTIVSMVLVVSDDTGLWVMASAFGLLVLVMGFWTWAYFDRFGSFGILPERVEKPEQPVAKLAPKRAPGPARPTVTRPESVAAAGAKPAKKESPTQDEAAERTVKLPDKVEEEPAAPAAAAADESRKSEEAPAEKGTAEAEPQPRLETPEERLAHAESPIDHGSAEGDLDLAAERPRRPGMRGKSPAPRSTSGGDRDTTTPDIAGPPVPPELERES